MKLLICLFFGIITSPFLYLCDYYMKIVADNKTFIVLLFSAFIVDVLCGMWKHLKCKDFSFRELLTKALTKIGITFMAMVLFNAMAGIEGVGESGVKVYLLLVGKLMNLFYISGSAFNNMYYITGGKFPPIAWMDKMKEFDKTLDIEKLKSKN